MNRSQLEESVKCEYGSGVEASKYLQKFVHVWASLPKNNDNGNYDVKRYLIYCLNKINDSDDVQYGQDLNEIYGELAFYYKLSFREVERSLTNYSLIHNLIGQELSHNYQLMLVYLSIIKVIKPEIHQILSNNSISYEQLASETSLKYIVDNWLESYKDNKSIALLTLLLKLCLSSEEEYISFCKKNIGDFIGAFPTINYFQRQDKFILKRICKWMNTFEIR